MPEQHTIRLNLDNIQNELRCPICQAMFQDPVVIMEVRTPPFIDLPSLLLNHSSSLSASTASVIIASRPRFARVETSVLHAERMSPLAAA